MFPSKMTTRAAAEDRYGVIDFSSRYWHDQKTWLKLFNVSKSFPNWKVLDTQIPVTHIACNLDIHEPLAVALNSIDEKSLGYLLKTFDGCFNIRMVRGTLSSFSAHSYGLALDLNASENPLGSTVGGFYNHPELVKCFTNVGFDWGGNFHGRKDPMHFSYCWE